MRAMRIFGWYRVIPMAFVLLAGAVSFAYVNAPSPLVRPLYPLEYREFIAEASETYGVDPYLLAAMIETESNWIPDAVSKPGAQGLMQVMSATAQDMAQMGLVDTERFDSGNLDDPETNIMYGCAYIRYLIDYFNGSIDYAVAAYNAGMSNVEDWAREPTALHNAITFPETQAYLVRVKNAWGRYQELYAGVFETRAS